MLYLPTFIALLWLGPVTSLGVTAAPLGTNPMQVGHLSLPRRSVHEQNHTWIQPDPTIKRSDTSIVELDDTVAEVGSLPKRSDTGTESGGIVDEPGMLPR